MEEENMNLHSILMLKQNVFFLLILFSYNHYKVVSPEVAFGSEGPPRRLLGAKSPV